MLLMLTAVVICLAFANGANDNFKGVATLLGSQTTSFVKALVWATLCTLMGSLVAVLLSGGLLKNFSGKGLVDESLVVLPEFAACVALGAGLTVLLATRLGFPISTTHGILGALVGTAAVAGSAINAAKLLAAFVLPLLISPLLAFLATILIYPVLRRARMYLGVNSNSCFCIGSKVVQRAITTDSLQLAVAHQELKAVHGDTLTCCNAYSGSVLGIDAEPSLNFIHFLSAGAVSFARGLNDTPKIAALLLVAPQSSPIIALLVVGMAMAAGGLIYGRQVAETMSRKITPMNHGQGLTANLLTALITIGASRWAMPVSTTHVSCGTLFGIGVVTGRGKWQIILSIVFAWIVTLPIGALMGAICWTGFKFISA